MALAIPAGASAQAFEADYGLDKVRISPMMIANSRLSGAGLSLDTGRHWFAQVGVSQALPQVNGLPGIRPTEDMVNIGGGYRWSNGQSLSLQLNRGRAPDRLGLAVSYDWPRYFVRFSYDSGVQHVLPQDNVRFSAGFRF